MNDFQTSSSSSVLQFSPWQSVVDIAFWEHLARRKLHVAKLSEEPWGITGHFSPANHDRYSSLFYLSSESLSPTEVSSSSNSFAPGNTTRFSAPGTLYNFNTLEKFKEFDRASLLKETAKQIWDDIHSGKAIADPSLLLRFVIISFADLKKWGFYYWIAFPALVLPEPAQVSPPKPVTSVFRETQVEAIQWTVENWRKNLQVENKSQLEDDPKVWGGQNAFLVHLVNESASSHSLQEWEKLQEGEGEGEGEGERETILAFFDPCHLPTNPGWPLRNLVALAVASWQVRKIRVICLRERRGRIELQHSPCFEVFLPVLQEWTNPDICPNAIGWERNSRGKYGPRFADLAPTMDPIRLASEAADLNLKLMRWRVLPSLDLPRLVETKTLILGSGTLGCQVARGLMAWGIRKITLLDYGNVSFSNPLRQSLFNFDDCLNGGLPKAEAAKENIKKIYPGMEVEAVQMAIPMPGHAVSSEEEERVRGECRKLQSLVESHDVVFLCTDTRESRWLPTVLCSSANKIAINAALGFDTYLVMRHGSGPHLHFQENESLKREKESGGEGFSLSDGKSKEEDFDSVNFENTRKEKGKSTEETRLGCYFCSDVVAPLDSTTNRTLDQQCTVTRPGLAPIAASLAVELAISLLHHPQGIQAPPDSALDVTKNSDLPLGIIPHQLRGFLSHFSQLVISGTAFDKCTACSPKVVSEFKSQGFDFLLRSFNEPTFLEDLTGLTELMRSTNDVILEWDDDNDDEKTGEIDDGFNL